jgi:DNA topoisomerase-2
VKELPISLWIDKFKDYVEELIELKEIKSYKNYSTDVLINFELEEGKEGIECSLDNLKLTSTISTNNMVLFNERGEIKKYEEVSDILEEFCTVRYGYYVKRKEYIIKDLEYQLLILMNKMKFLRDVMSGSLVVQEIDEDVLSKEMEKRGYFSVSDSSTDDSVIDGDTKLSNYRYLLSMNIRSFTKQKLDILQKEIDKLQGILDKIRLTTPSDMWLSDLEDFEKEYK